MNRPYKLGITKFTHYNYMEFKNLMLKNERTNQPSYKIPYTIITNYSKDSKNFEFNEWVKNGHITNVKDQGLCSSSWAYTTIEAIQSALSILYKNKMSFSEKQLIDCNSNNNGCNGGNPRKAYEYIMKYGIELSYDYPNDFSNNSCTYNKKLALIPISQFIDLHNKGELALRSIIQHNHPITVGLHADGDFQFYKSGIYSSNNCKHKNINTYALGVGFGSVDGEQYFILKNSWGTSWGENGYMKISRNKNMCGIATDPTIPILSAKPPFDK